MRRLAVLAGLLVPSGLHAQLPAVGVPRGVVRVELDGSMEIWDHRWLDGVRQPLAADLTSPALGSDLIPTLAAADALIGSMIGVSGYRLNLGALTSDAQQEDTRGYLGLALGLTRKITVFGRMPLVEVRTEISYALAPTAGADAGANPGAATQQTFFQQFDASLASLEARISGGDFDSNPTLKAQAQSTLASGTTLRDGLFGLLGDPNTASPFVPIATSAAGQALTTRVTTLQTALANDFGVAGFTATPSLPDALTTTEQFVNELSDPSGPFALRPGGSKLTFRGDAEAGLALTLVDRWDRPGHQGGFRTAVEGLVRFPTGRLARTDRVLALGTGDGQTDIEGRITTDLGAGRWGLRAEGAYNRQLAADYVLRVAPPTQPLAGIDRLSAVRRDPGDIVSIAVQPFFRLAPSFALQGLATYWSRGADEVSYLTVGDEIPGVDASVLAEDSKATAMTLGFGVTYSSLGRLRPGGRGLPVDASWSYERVVRTTGGIVPDRHAMTARLRLY
ncbi:MAG TPA: hypothetical protein VJQ46_07935, partial [Gemmatimonadales bacterium]|nr:hypothetical protein [Gemmatimonadales bacterium]